MHTFDLSDAARQTTPLCEIMGRNKSDKGSLDIYSRWHNYTLIYYDLFKDWVDRPLRIFELGLGTNNVNVPSNMGVNGRPGASLFGWAEFFKQSQVYGADIDRGILFQTDRIQTYYCDQTNPFDIQMLWQQEELKADFDIIIEDGLHTFEANVCFFENSIHKLKRGGYYIIEDITAKLDWKYEKKIEQWKKAYPELTFQLINLPNIRNVYDNVLLIVHRS